MAIEAVPPAGPEAVGVFSAVNARRALSRLSPVDLASIGFLLLLTALSVLFHSRIREWLTLVAVNLAVIAGIVSLAQYTAERGLGFLLGLHRWYCYLVVLLVFRELNLMVHPIHPVDYDPWFIAADRWMFGVNPTQWIGRFVHPVFTEILQIAYFSYYLLFIVLGVGMYRRRVIEDLDRAAFLVVYGFYLCYILYFCFPGVGPRFTLHHFSTLGTDLRGLYLADYLRAIVNAGESIPSASDRVMDVVQRDLFPSGHAQQTIIVVALAFRYRLLTRWWLLALGVLLIVATVYLRYHYVVDLIAGAALAGFTLWSGSALEAWWRRTAERLRESATV